MFDDFIAIYQNGHWMMRVFTVVLVVVTINLFLRVFLARVQNKVQQTETIWDDAIFEAINQPLRLLVWVLGLGIAAEFVEPVEKDTLFTYVDPIRQVGVLATLIWFLVRLVQNIEAGLLERGELRGEAVDKTTVEAIAKLLRLSVIITGALVILQTLGFSVSGVLAFGGIGGLAIGFAAKDLLANLFGGLTIYLDRPFTVGDWVRSPEADIEGTVEKIGWRTTRIRRFDKRPIYVPNSLFTSMVVENPSRMTNRRIYETIGLRYDDVALLDGVVKEVRDYLSNHVEIDQQQTLIVNFNEFGASSLDFFVYCFTKTTNWVRFHEVKHELLMDIHRIIEKHGAEVAFPTRTVLLAGQEGAMEALGASTS